jgi:Tol biopolymer transport system component
MSRTAFLLSASVVLALVVACLAALLIVSKKPAQATFPGTNGDIVFAGATARNDLGSRILRMSSDGKGVRVLTTQGFSAAPEWSPNGKKIAYSRTSNDFTPDGEIYLMNADGSGKVNLTNSSTRYEFSPSFYPSGRRIIFSAAPEGNLYVDMELYAISFDAAGNATDLPKRLTNNRFPDISPVVSEDGKKIAFVSARDENAENFGDREIYVMNTAPEGPNNQPVQLTDNTYDDSSPDFSANGRRIVYDSRGSDNVAARASANVDEIMVMSAKDGSKKKNLTLNNPTSNFAPAFSPEGDMVAFIRYDPEQQLGAIWKMRADGSGQTKVRDLYGDVISSDNGPDWQSLP